MQAAPDQAYKWYSDSFLSTLVIKFVVLQSNDVIDLTKQGRPAPAPAQASLQSFAVSILTQENKHWEPIAIARYVAQRLACFACCIWTSA